jgi:2-polyprenyl-3-methyl-5-hydroxy-6-metoxy-1,4-benzoquinol methylase
MGSRLTMPVIDAWPASQLEYLGRCPVCGEDQARLVYANLRDKLFHSSGDAWKLHACAACGTHYLDPRPSRESIARAYTDYPTHEGPRAPAADAVAGSSAGKVAGVLRALANGYRNARWGMHLEPSLPIGRYVVPCMPPLRDALVQQMRSLPRLPANVQGRLLDVGCGSGEFLQLATSAGWSVQGSDFDGAAVATARRRGLDVRQGGLEVLHAIESESVDWTSLSHVLEHVHDQVSWLQQVHRVLRPGGTLWLQTPNVASLGHARYRENWRGLEPPRHLALWTFETLCKTLQDVGFRSMRALPTPMITAMELYANSEALQRGLDHAGFMALPRSRQRRLKDIWPALWQHWFAQRGEFLTVTAVR